MRRVGRHIESLLSAAFQRSVAYQLSSSLSRGTRIRHDVEQAPHAMRTVWLALLCLIVLATTVVVRIISPYASADVSRGVPFAKAEVSRETTSVALSSENVTAETKLQNDPSTKADKLEGAYTNEAAPEVKSVKSVA